jgi:hypothetical protein
MKPYLPFLLVPPLVVGLAACTATVTHPTKSAAEMNADVTACTRESNRRYWMDPVAALYTAYDCLEARGYQRSERDFAAKVERAMGERAPPPPAHPPGPCRVPCRRN